MTTPSIILPPTPVSAPKETYSLAEIVEQIDSGKRWGSQGGADVTFSFPRVLPADWEPYSTLLHKFEAFEAAAVAGTYDALSRWAQVADLHFSPAPAAGPGEVSQTIGLNEHGQMRFFGMSVGKTAEVNGSMQLAPAAGLAYGGYPGGGRGGDVRFNIEHGDTYTSAMAQMDPGGLGHRVLMHEIGHALGLSHPGDYDAGQKNPDGSNINYNDNAEYLQDSRQYTLMSYWSEANTGADYNRARPDTPLLHDIYVIQQKYGANTATRTGNSIYGYNSNIGDRVYDFTLNTDPVLTIWDAGGTDRLDLSGVGSNVVLDLRQGHFSSTHGMTENISIAYGTVIESAFGGAGNDTLIGNDAGNALGGGAGNDTLVGGGGVDFLNGGGGADRVDYSYFDGGVGIDLEAGTAQSLTGPTVETLWFIENVFGSQGADAIYGSSGVNDLEGEGGDDLLAGRSGNDRLEGESGNDVLRGGNGDDVLRGGSGADTLSGDAGSDRFVYFDTADSSGSAMDIIQGFDGVGPAIALPGGTPSAQDTIDVAAIDAKEGTSGNQQFTFWGDLTDAQGRAKGAGALWVYDLANGQTQLHGNVDGDTTIEFRLRIADETIDAADYLSSEFLL